MGSGFLHALTMMFSPLPPRSNDPAAKGAPSGFTFLVRELRASVGAGFLIPICGEMMMIPGLPTRPAYYEVGAAPRCRGCCMLRHHSRWLFGAAMACVSPGRGVSLALHSPLPLRVAD